MKKSKILAVTLIAAMALSSSASHSGTAIAAPTIARNANPGWIWVVFGCAGGIVFTAMLANWQQKRQLTAAEAATCGILYYFTVPRLR